MTLRYHEELRRLRARRLKTVRELHDRHGLSFREIGQRMEISGQRAHQLYTEATER